MASKGRAAGYGSEGSVAAKNVFKVKFSQPLSSKVRYECYDNDQTYPAVDDNNTNTTHTVFGVYATSKSMIALRDTTGGTAGAGTSWFPTGYNANTATINRMKGTEYYVTQHGATLSTANGSITFNMQIEIPSVVETTDNMQFDLAIRYTYTGTTPTLTWYFNQVAQSTTGTESSPVWATMPPGSWGIRHTRADTPWGGPYLANIPSSGVEKTQQGWITDA